MTFPLIVELIPLKNRLDKIITKRNNITLDQTLFVFPLTSVPVEK